MSGTNLTTKYTIDLLTKAYESGLRFAIVRGVESVDSKAGDADVLVESSLPLVHFIKKYCRTHNGYLLPVIRRHYVEIHRLVLVVDGSAVLLKIDIHNGEQWRGVTYLEKSDAIASAKLLEGLPRLSDSNSVIANLFQCSLPTGRVFESRRNRISTKMELMSSLELAKLQAFLSDIGLQEVWLLLGALKIDAASKVIFAKRVQIWRTLFFKKPIKSVGNVFCLILTHFFLKLFPQGTFISIIGPDGAGKTTLINALKARFVVYSKGDLVHVQHWRPEYLTPLSEYKVKVVEKGAKSRDLDRGGSQVAVIAPSIMESTLRFAYYILDYLFGYWFVLRRVLTKDGLVVCDRYVEDWVVSPASRSRVQLPLEVKKFFGRIVPTPKMRFYLRGSPELLFARKQEETLEELRELVDIYDESFLSDEHIHVLDASVPTERLVDTIVLVMCKAN